MTGRCEIRDAIVTSFGVSGAHSAAHVKMHGWAVACASKSHKANTCGHTRSQHTLSKHPRHCLHVASISQTIQSDRRGLEHITLAITTTYKPMPHKIVHPRQNKQARSASHNLQDCSFGACAAMTPVGVRKLQARDLQCEGRAFASDHRSQSEGIATSSRLEVKRSSMRSRGRAPNPGHTHYLRRVREPLLSASAWGTSPADSSNKPLTGQSWGICCPVASA